MAENGETGKQKWYFTGKMRGNGEKRGNGWELGWVWVCRMLCCLAVYKGITHVSIKVIADPTRKGVTSTWFSKLLSGAIKMETMIAAALLYFNGVVPIE